MSVAAGLALRGASGFSRLPKDSVHHISQHARNGGSSLGTFQAPRLPNWVPGKDPSNGVPWGDYTAKSTNYYDTVPDTGVTRYYDFTVTRGPLAPDGVQIEGVLINGQYPGPMIEANWGDWIQVTVTNNLPDEGTALHWHGFLQKQTPWMDGVPGVQQCPIAPGITFTYYFQAQLYGTSWYHSHYSAQYAGGAAGAMIVHGPKNADYDIDLGPILLSDWNHKDYIDVVEQTMAPADANPVPPKSDNNLINGMMSYDCSQTSLPCTPDAGVAQFNFTSGKRHRLRLINSGAEAIQFFSIDNHTMSVIANDFVEIEPYTTDVVTLGIGQRADVIVEATGNPMDVYWMRSNIGPSFENGGCSSNNPNASEALAIIYYENANTSAIPTSQIQPDISFDNTHCHNDPLSQTQPFYPMAISHPGTVEEINMSFQSNGTHFLWYMNNSTFRADYNDPTLLEAKMGKTSFPEEASVYNFGSNSSVRLIIYNWSQQPHPMHMHGHNLFILAEGIGKWDGSITNPGNPQRRDVQLVQPGTADAPSYIVVQFDQDNPGVWAFHCHIAWHVSMGMYINILERPNDVKQLNIPDSLAQTCRGWGAWTGNHIPDEIDSGV